MSVVSNFTANSLGARGPEPNGARVRVVTIGGSTTACAVLDVEEAWPTHLMNDLNPGSRRPDNEPDEIARLS